MLDQRQEWKAEYMGSLMDKLYQLNCTAVSDAPPSAVSIENIDLWQSTLRPYTLAVKKNCSFVMQIVTWFASVGTSFSQSSSGSGSRDTLTMFNLHLCLIFPCSLRAIGHAFLTMILSSFFVVFHFCPGIFKSLTLPVTLGFFKILLTLWLQPT